MSTNPELEINQAILDRVARRRRRQHVEQAIVTWLLRAAALISILTTVGIIVILVAQSAGFFKEVSVWDFLTGTQWTPLLKPQQFGVLSLVGGTLLVAAIAGIVSLTLGLGAAIFLSEYAPEKLRRVLKPILEVLAGIPTVVYGYFALTFITPILQGVFGSDRVIVFNALSAGLVMGLMIMPMVSTLSEDAMVAVPRSLRDAAYALGATRFEVATKVVIPAALSGIVASFILAVSRAVGETMIVKIAAGATPNLTLNPLESIQAMTAYIVQVSLGETPQGSLEYKTIFAVGLLLFAMTLVMNIVGRWVISRFRQQYN
jgi:phosphate transport system permease protein